MIRTLGAIYLIILLFIEQFVLINTAAECDYGSVNVSVRTSDGAWENATVHPLLKRGESFDIQVIVTAKTVLQVFFVKLHEFGTPVFEVKNGPVIIEQTLEYRGKISLGKIFIYIWKIQVRPNTTWVNGYAPLEVFVQFNKNDNDEQHLHFDVLTAFIIDEFWEDYTQEPTNKNFSFKQVPVHDQPEFEFGEVIIAVFLLCIFIRLGKYFQ